MGQCLDGTTEPERNRKTRVVDKRRQLERHHMTSGEELKKPTQHKITDGKMLTGMPNSAQQNISMVPLKTMLFVFPLHTVHRVVNGNSGVTPLTFPAG